MQSPGSVVFNKFQKTFTPRDFYREMLVEKCARPFLGGLSDVLTLGGPNVKKTCDLFNGAKNIYSFEKTKDVFNSIVNRKSKYGNFQVINSDILNANKFIPKNHNVSLIDYDTMDALTPTYLMNVNKLCKMFNSKRCVLMMTYALRRSNSMIMRVIRSNLTKSFYSRGTMQHQYKFPGGATMALVSYLLERK